MRCIVVRLDLAVSNTGNKPGGRPGHNQYVVRNAKSRGPSAASSFRPPAMPATSPHAGGTGSQRERDYNALASQQV